MDAHSVSNVVLPYPAAALTATTAWPLALARSMTGARDTAPGRGVGIDSLASMSNESTATGDGARDCPTSDTIGS